MLRWKAVSLLEEKVLTKLIEEGYVSIDPTCGVTETIADLVEDEDVDEEVVVDGEVDEGDVHIKPTLRKTTRLVHNSTLLLFLSIFSRFYEWFYFLYL